MQLSLHLAWCILLRLVASLASATLARPVRRDPKGRYLPAPSNNEPSEPPSLIDSFVFPSLPDLTTSPAPIISYTPPPAPPSTPQLSTTPTPPDNDDFMPENVNPFWGDDEHPEESPQDFLKAMQRWGLNKTNATNTQKLENFRLNLKSNAAAEQWFDALPAED
jgi:hypothetical protein